MFPNQFAIKLNLNKIFVDDNVNPFKKTYFESTIGQYSLENKSCAEKFNSVSLWAKAFLLMAHENMLQANFCFIFSTNQRLHHF